MIAERRTRVVCLFFFVLLLGAVGAFRLRTGTPPFSCKEGYMGIYMVEDSVLQGKEKGIADTNLGVLFEGTLLPYDRDSNALFLPQSLGRDAWSGRLTAQVRGEEYYVCAPQDRMWENKTDAIRDGYEYTLWLIGERTYYEYRLIVTGTPVMAITTEREEIPVPPPYEEDPDGRYFNSEPRYYGTVDVFDPDMAGEKYVITETDICYHDKGAGSRVFPKQSYSLELINASQENVNVSLLGMREDNSWKLNSLYTDSSRVREKTAIQLWEAFDASDVSVSEPGPKMQYVELILDHVYQGLYGLVEPVDRKKLQLKEGDVLYKIIDWQIPEDEAIRISAVNGWKIAYPIRIRYPKEIQDYAGTWQPIRDYLRCFYRPEGIGDPEAFSMIDINNIVDYSFFMMVAAGNDNNFKNMYLAARRKDGYRITQIPWDLDYTFGNVFSMETNTRVIFDEDVTRSYETEVLIRLHNAAPRELDPLIWEKWCGYRESFLDIKQIEKLF